MLDHFSCLEIDAVSPFYHKEAPKDADWHSTWGHPRFLLRTGFSPDGKRLVSGSYDKTIKIWDISSLDTSR